ncbi:MAG: hypothetical protein HQL12_05765 [Candidatus Omnitrophica bacterium]|nr:hypothetical protein [Candidatus Omnitrophota bacterium]
MASGCVMGTGMQGVIEGRKIEGKMKRVSAILPTDSQNSPGGAKDIYGQWDNLSQGQGRLSVMGLTWEPIESNDEYDKNFYLISKQLKK